MVKIERINYQADKCGLKAPFTPTPFNTCLGAVGTLNFDPACGPEDDRTPDTGACASTACTALVASFDDEKVEMMAAGFASCTGDHAGYYEHFADVNSVKAMVVSQVGQCGLTAPFTPIPLDSCAGARMALDTSTPCGEEDERTPGTGACASAACATFFDSITDANVELMVAGLASCTGAYAGYSAYAAAGSGYLKLALFKPSFASCGRTAPFPQEPLDTCFGALEEVRKFDTECGEKDARTPDTGKCASLKCYQHMDSFTDAKVQLMVTGFKSCPSGLPGPIPYSTMDSVYAKSLLTDEATSCGLSPRFTSETSYGPGSVGGDFLLKVQDGCEYKSPTDTQFVDMCNWIKRADVETRVVSFGSSCKTFMTSCYPAQVQLFEISDERMTQAAGKTYCAERGMSLAVIYDLSELVQARAVISAAGEEKAITAAESDGSGWSWGPGTTKWESDGFPLNTNTVIGTPGGTDDGVYLLHGGSGDIDDDSVWEAEHKDDEHHVLCRRSASDAVTDSYLMNYAVTGCPSDPPKDHLYTLRWDSQFQCEDFWNSLKGLDDLNAIKAMVEQQVANGAVEQQQELDVYDNEDACNPVATLARSSDCGQIFAALDYKIIGVASSAGDVAGSCETCGNDAVSCPSPSPPPPSPASPGNSTLKLGGSAQTAEDTGANVGAIVGGAVGGLAVLAVVIGVVVYLKKKAQAAKPPAAGVEVQSVKVENI